MASGATDARLIMGRMFELHVRRRRKFIHPPPRDFDFPIGIVDDLLDLGFVTPQFRVAQHAFVHSWNTRGGARVSANMTICAIEPHFYVRVMGKCHRLLCVRHARRQQHAQPHPPQSMRLPVNHRIGLTYHVT